MRWMAWIGCLVLALSGSGQETDARLIIQYPGDFEQRPATQGDITPPEGHFQFAIVGDRTGGHRAGVFPEALHRLNRLQPDFVMSIGDLIEGLLPNASMAHRQWDQFDGFVEALDMPFFYLPGNHDYNNPTLAKVWEERFGPSYYHFVHEGVLFLCLNSEEHMMGSGDGELGEPQFNYFENVLETHADVKWTMVFMHQPLWRQETTGYWPQLAALLEGRQHTVFAGHYHRYLKEEVSNAHYYTLATTGGGSLLRGPDLGEFDHFMWVTMTPNGPIVANVLVDGILDDGLRFKASNALAERVVDAQPVRFKPEQASRQEACQVITLLVENPLDLPCVVRLDGNTHYQAKGKLSDEKFTVAPNNHREIQLTLTRRHDQYSAQTPPYSISCRYTYAPEGAHKAEVQFDVQVPFDE